MKAVIFDMDGVMFDTEAVAYRAWMRAAGETEHADCEGLESVFWKTTGTTIKTIDVFLDSFFGDPGKRRAFTEKVVFYMEEELRNNPVPVKKGLCRLLEFLEKKGVLTAIASSSPEATITRYLREGKIEHRFTVIQGGDQSCPSKPNPQIYQIVCEKLNCSPEEAIVIEDSQNGLLAAHGAGCRTVFVPDMWEPKGEAKTDYIWKRFRDLDEVAEWFRANEKE